MATHHFGTTVNPAHFVEIADPANPGQVIRPIAGTTVKVRDASTLANLPDITLDNYGYWSYTTEDIPEIYVSGDDWVTSVGPLLSKEAEQAAVDAGENAATALQTANDTANAMPDVAAQAVDDRFATFVTQPNPLPQYLPFHGGNAPTVWARTIAQGFPTATDGAADGDYVFLEP